VLSSQRFSRRRRRQRRAPPARQRSARALASRGGRRLHQVRSFAGRRGRIRDSSTGRARGRPHPRPCSPQHRSARHSRTTFRRRSSKGARRCACAGARELKGHGRGEGGADRLLMGRPLREGEDRSHVRAGNRACLRASHRRPRDQAPTVAMDQGDVRWHRRSGRTPTSMVVARSPR